MNGHHVSNPTSGVVFPILGGMLGDMGNFPLAFSLCGFACLLGAAAIAIVFPPHQSEAHQPFSVHGFFHQLHIFDHEVQNQSSH